MKNISIRCILVFIVFAGFAFTPKKNANTNSIYGVWSEDVASKDTTETFQVAFYPGGKINVVRRLHNYIGYYKIHSYQTNYIDGDITIGEHFPFTVAFITPSKIELSINYNNHIEVRYLQKTKNIKSGFQLIDKRDKAKI